MEQELQQEIGSEDLEKEENQEQQQETTSQADAQRLQVEEKARESGWVPESEFRGDKRRWRDADAWNRHADTMLPIAKAANRKLEAKIVELEAALATSQGTLNRIVKVQDKFAGDFYDTELSEIRAATEAAVESGDVATYRMLREREAKLSKPEPVQANTPEGADKQIDGVHPAVMKWRMENPWFDPSAENPKGDDIMTAYVLRVGAQLAEKNDPVSMPGKEEAFCQRITEIMKAKFPDKFSNPNRLRPGDIDETNLRGAGEEFTSDNGTRDWNHLPNAAKAACMKQIAANPKITKAAWVKYYYEQEGA